MRLALATSVDEDSMPLFSGRGSAEPLAGELVLPADGTFQGRISLGNELPSDPPGQGDLRILEWTYLPFERSHPLFARLVQGAAGGMNIASLDLSQCRPER
jgi:hypothetical protein